MASRTSGVKTWRYHELTALLSSVFLEWVLMLLLLLEGLLSYLVTAFARICKLQAPCPMCTRLDHVLGKAQPGFYRDLICSSHKAEASSWAFCHIHQKLVDVHSMCEACLLPFATDKKYMVGKLGVGSGNAACRNYFSMRNDATEAPVMKEGTLCSCCSRPLKVNSHPFVVLQSKDSGIGIEGTCGVVSRDHQHIDENNCIAYSELKTCDSEPDLQQLGGNVGGLPNGDADNLKEGFALGRPLTKTADDIPPYQNSLENIPRQSELIRLQNGGDFDNKTSENSGELCNIQPDVKANIQSTKDAQQITECSDTKDKSENDVWHNALSSTEELPVAAKCAETGAVADENKAELTQRSTRKNSFKVHEDLKILLSQLSTASQAPDIDSPNVQNQHEQAILHNITRAISLERNSSGISESMAGEPEGDSTIDQLKQQIELDRKSISRLWKELEEERNASAVAANQTMAMITRLQEEKAAMQMEALQYQRMMEEQSEYDREDLQKMAETVRSLQAEVEGYKTKLRDQLLADEIRGHMRLEEHKPGISSMARSRSLSGFENEKTHIAKRLKKLRQKLHEFSNNSRRVPSPELSGDRERSVDDGSSDDAYEDAAEEKETDGASASVKHPAGRRNGGSFGGLRQGGPKGQYHAMVSESELASFEDDLSQVSARLQALESDRSFLEHSVNSLRNGEAGEELVRDIARSLRELRRMGITWKE